MIPNIFLLLITDEQFKNLVNFPPFDQFKDFVLEDLSGNAFYNENIELFFHFNLKNGSVYRVIFLPLGRMNPAETEILDYSVLIRHFKLNEILGED